MQLWNHEWKDFHLYDLFKIDSGNKFDKSKMTFYNPTVNFVGRARTNNGITAQVDAIDNVEPYAAGSLTVALGGSYLGSCFLQDQPFYTSQNVNVLIPLCEDMSDTTKLFISHLVRFESASNYKAFARELNAHIKKNFVIKLPVDSKGNLDTKYIDAFITNMKTDVTTIPDYFLDEGYKKACWYMDNINQHAFEKEYAGSLSNKKIKLDVSTWGKFKVSDLFYIHNGKGITQQEIADNEGDFPAVQSGESNNGIMGYIDKEYCKEKGYTLIEKACLTVARSGSSGYISFQKNGCCVGDSAKILELRSTNNNPYVLLFLKTILMANKYRYLYARKVTEDNYSNEEIMLPITSEQEPDYKFMEEYIKSLSFSVGI
ncbi:restriction endonuclease subunit S [Butyrivibrio sp. XBB1001]|uniref:restriction endonuclease subunit S n=1 Tax=Butyrivibrio sp. XBB1001 TaxID=1280682 RepID=UPI000417665D|nr:restriction endonuclease subunit S [Butyrivibrio sp. XBB1001]